MFFTEHRALPLKCTPPLQRAAAAAAMQPPHWLYEKRGRMELSPAENPFLTDPFVFAWFHLFFRSRLCPTEHAPTLQVQWDRGLNVIVFFLKHTSIFYEQPPK